MIDSEQHKIRRYLLGYLDEKEMEGIEERYLSEPGYREEMLAIEEDLIDDYLAENLTPEDRSRFDTHFLSNPQQAQRVLVARALNRYCAEEAHNLSPLAPSASPAEPAPRTKSKLSLFSKPILAYGLAAIAVVALIAISWFFISQRRSQDSLDLRRELARLNGPEGTANTPGLNVTLLPIALRGGETTPKLSTSQDVEIIQLTLVLPAAEHRTYRAIIKCDNDSNEYSIENLEPKVTSSGTAILLKLPARLLKPGDCYVEVKGLASNGSFVAVAEYRLQLVS